MAGDRVITVELEDRAKLAVTVEQVGPVMVADEDVVGRLAGVTASIEKVGREVLETLKRIEPAKATVELGFGLALESGQLIALWGKGKERPQSMSRLNGLRRHREARTDVDVNGAQPGRNEGPTSPLYRARN